MSSSVIVRATRPLRSFFNQRFDDVQRRLEVNEKRLVEVLEEMERQSEDMREMQRALLDSITLLGSLVAQREGLADSPASAGPAPDRTGGSARSEHVEG